MKADWNDAPARVRRRKSTRSFIIALISVFGFASTAIYATHFFPKIVKSLKHADKTLQSVEPRSVRPSPSTGENSYRPIVEAVEDPYLEQVNRMLGITSDYISEPIAEIEWSTSEGKREEVGERNTVFSDTNYAPPESINTIRMPKPQAQPAAPRQQQKPYVTVVTETKLNCWPFKEGSPECRKYKAQIHQQWRRRCETGAGDQSYACRQANRYDLR